MALIGLLVITPLLALFVGVCYISYLSVRVLHVFGVVVIVFFCVPAGYTLLRLISVLWILFD